MQNEMRLSTKSGSGWVIYVTVAWGMANAGHALLNANTAFCTALHFFASCFLSTRICNTRATFTRLDTHNRKLFSRPFTVFCETFPAMQAACLYLQAFDGLGGK
jgi:hypothetical protein